MALAPGGVLGSMVHASKGAAPLQSIGSLRPLSPLLLTLLVLLGSGAEGVEGWTSAPCGTLLEGPQGYFHSPNFPRRFDTPLLCRWVIHAPPNHKIILYFTQFYLKESFHLTEYTTYNGPDDHTGEKPLAGISFRNEIKYVASYRPYVVVNFNVHTMRNMHLRVDEHLMDVFGFNITYEIVPRDQEVRNDTCTVQDCSYLGNCVISADYSAFSCECFEGFFGKECQFGPYCDPDRGINSCDNGGQCRYYYGSLVNTCDCPPGFEGVRCETLQTHNDACVRLGCSQSCRVDEGSQGYCVCYAGYKLQPDNVTCIEKEMYAVAVTVEVFKFPFLLPTPRMQSLLREHAQQMQKILDGISNITFEYFYSGHISYVKPWYVWQFRVLVERQQEEEAVALLPSLLQQGVCMAASSGQSRCGTVTISSNPEMKLLTVENYDQRPALEGKLLTIACSARGSVNLHFQWLKDGSPINMTWPDRNMWEVRIPPTTEKKQMSVLNIDDVTIYDRGVFTCVIRDQGQQQNKSVMVDVITLPLVELTPPSANLEAGHTVEIRCLSPEDTRRTFTYEWLANGVTLGSADPNYFIEELFPTGLMLEIRAAKPSTNFTCRVRNEAGTTSLTATVFVIPENTTRGYCERVTGANGLVKWDKTYDGNYDVQNCPVDSGDMLISRIGNGYSTRRCSCDEVRGCVWAEPNLARCQSGRLIEIYDELEKLRIGYQSNTSASIFDSLYRLICRARSKLIAGDVDFTAAILHSLVHTIHQHPFLAPTQGLFNLTNMLDFMNILLEEGLSSNIDEIRDLYTGMRLLHIASILSEMQLGIKELRTRLVARGKIEVEMTHVIVNDTAQLETDREGDGEKNLTRQRRARETGEDAGIHETGPRTLPAYKFTVRDIYPLLKIQEGERPDYLSDLVILHTAVHTAVPPTLDPVTVVLQHRLDIGLVMGGNETVCLRWIETKIADDGFPATARSIGERSLYGRWSRNGCHVISMTPTNTTCSCVSPGIFSLTLQPRQLHVELLKERVYDAVLLAGGLITALALLVALVIHVITCRSRHRGQRMSPFQASSSSGSSNTKESTYGVQFDWRDMIGDHHFTHLNLILCLCVINLLSVLCLYQYDSQSMCLTGKVLMQLFYLGAFSFLFLKTIQVFVDILNAKRMEKGCLKYFLIGWGIPILMTGAVVVGSEVSDRDSDCSRWCFFTEHHWQFYVFLICAIFLFVVQTSVQIYCFVRIMRWENEDRFMDRRKHLATMGLCLTSSSLLTVMAVVGSMADTRGEPVFSWVFMLADLLLTVLTLVYFCYLNHQILRALRSIFRHGITQKRSSSSFRAYMMPEKVEEKPESPEESIQKYYIEVDRAKYTAEHKRKLRFLLGSSASGGEEVVQPLAVGPGFREEGGAHGGLAQAQEFVVDSGISEGTDSDRSSFKQMMEIEPHSGPSSIERDCDVRFLSDIGCSRV